MNKEIKYDIHLDIKHSALELIDINKIVDECTDTWFNQTLSKVNDSVVRIGIVEGEFHWHKHDEDDEFFYIIEGNLIIELEDRIIDLKAGQGVTIPKGVLHFPKAPIKTIMLMVETAAIKPTGDQ